MADIPGVTTDARAARDRLLEIANSIKETRDRFAPEPHALEGAPLLVWQRLNAAQGFARRAARALGDVIDPLRARQHATDPDTIAALETLAGLTQDEKG